MFYNAFNVYHRELAPGIVSLTGDRAQGDDSKHWAYCSWRVEGWKMFYQAKKIKYVPVHEILALITSVSSTYTQTRQSSLLPYTTYKCS